MNGFVVAAAILTLAMAGGHSTIGLRWVLPNLHTATLPRSPFGGPSMTRSAIGVTWHAVTVVLLAFTVILALLARSHSGDAAITVRAIGGGFAVLTAILFWTVRRHPASLLRAPVWALYIATAVTCLVGASQ